MNTSKIRVPSEAFRALVVGNCLLSLALTGCGAAGEADFDDSASPVGEAQSEIINGIPVNNATAAREGIVKVESLVGTTIHGCTGTLLRNDVVLTARHCVNLKEELRS